MTPSRTVRDVMTPNPRSIDPDSSVTDAARMMLAEDVGSLPVVQGERLLGLITDRDIATRVVAEDRDPGQSPVGGIATRRVVSAHPDQSLEEALELMARHQVRRLPVVEDGHRLVGIVAQADVARLADDGATGEVVEQISEPRS